jgi:antitoxin PrlF
MIRSRLVSRGRTTVPRAVRRALDLREGDELAYQIGMDGVILTRADRAVTVDPFLAFGEWWSEADERAYGGL